MYIYSLYGFEDTFPISHRQKFTKEEFEKMCREVEPCDKEYDMYILTEVVNHLKEKYGFIEVQFQASFFIDGKDDE